jgi:dihydrolipoamide dehydrogenase
VVARKLETTAHEILNAVHPHPTMSEALKEATAVAYGEATDIYTVIQYFCKLHHPAV